MGFQLLSLEHVEACQSGGTVALLLLNKWRVGCIMFWLWCPYEYRGVQYLSTGDGLVRPWNLGLVGCTRCVSSRRFLLFSSFRAVS